MVTHKDPGPWEPELWSRVKYSKYGIQELRPERTRNWSGQRYGSICGSAWRRSSTKVLWDGLKTPQAIYTGFLEPEGEKETEPVAEHYRGKG